MLFNYIEEHKGDVTRVVFYRRFLILVTRNSFGHNIVTATVCYTRRFLTQHCKFGQQCYKFLKSLSKTCNMLLWRNVALRWCYTGQLATTTFRATFVARTFHSFCSSPRSSTLRLNFLFRGPHSFVHKPDSRSFTMRWNRFHWRVKDCSLRKFVKYLRWNRLIFPVRLVVCYSRKGEKRYYKHTVHTNFWSLFGLAVIVQRYDPLNERSQRRGWNSRGVRVIQNWR